QAFAGGNVLRHGNQEIRLAPGVLHDAQRFAYPDDRAVFTTIRLLYFLRERQRGFAQAVCQELTDSAVVFTVTEIKDAARKQLFPAVAEHAAKLVIGPQDMAVRRNMGNA